jgi:hypothetical protein
MTRGSCTIEKDFQRKYTTKNITQTNFIEPLKAYCLNEPTLNPESSKPFESSPKIADTPHIAVHRAPTLETKSPLD